ncbi:MAG: RDD family protein [Terracidiphilus sp.]
MSQPVPKPSWKQEVNRRLEAHKSRKGLSVVEDKAPQQEHADVSDRAAKAAARVAARFSKAPSYSEMQAAEARAALRDAEVATRAALEAQAAAQAALANLERAGEDQIEFEDETWTSTASASSVEQELGKSRSTNAAAMFFDGAGAHEPVSGDSQSATWEDLRLAASRSEDAAAPYSIEAQPIHANLIHFPRELVATRRLRPRSTGWVETSAAEQSGQLSIFEVDPSTVSIEATASTVETAAPAPSWSGPEWSSIELEMEPEEDERFYREPPSTRSGIHLAPLELRVMAATIDNALVLGLVCAGIAGIAGHMLHSPAVKVAEVSAFAALMLTGVLYQAFFLMIARATPGMMYAGISLCTFDDEHPSHVQLRGRLGALLVSLLPMGLGFAWAIFDEDRLSWHDRISRTYLRRC